MRPHDLRILAPFLADSGVDLVVDGFLRGQGGNGEEQGDRARGRRSEHRLLQGLSFYGSRAGSWSTSKVTEKSGASRRARPSLLDSVSLLVSS